LRGLAADADYVQSQRLRETGKRIADVAQAHDHDGLAAQAARLCRAAHRLPALAVLRIQPVRKPATEHEQRGDCRLRRRLAADAGRGGQLDAARQQRRHKRELLNGGAVEMHPFEVPGRKQCVGKAAVVFGAADIERLHRHFDAIAVGLRQSHLRVIGQMHDIGHQPDAPRNLIQLLAKSRDKPLGQQHAGHRTVPVP
jgi:hypothetical protein